MMLNRRKLIQSAGFAALACAVPARLWAQATIQSGATLLNSLSDGNLIIPKAFTLGEMPPRRADEILIRYGLTDDMLTPECNVTLLRTGDRTVLFDVGAGADFMPSAGRLIEALETLGVDPFDVTDVVFTHAHPDHLWGLLDDFGDMWFPEATYHIGQTEWDYWTDPNTVSTIVSDRQSFAVGAASRLAEIADKVVLFADGAEILSGVAARSTPGHTPGHMSFEVAVGSESIMIVGDAIGNYHVGFERPSWHAGSDQDGTLGAVTRASLLDQLAHEQMRFVGFHLPGGGIGRAEKRDQGYIFLGEGA
jgi:glyoxylase-like metal-dependent hydrolase (beta-lactamase superfamily II)